MRIRSRALLGFVFLLLPGFAGGVTPSLPRPDRYVTDRAGVLPADRAAALNERLAAFEREASTQVLVYVDRRVPEGTTLEELGAASLRAWGVGQKGKNNGVVFFVFPDDRKMRIEVGYGLEGAIPDARAHRITDEVVKPYFARGDLAAGIEAGTNAIVSAAKGEPFAGTGRTRAEARPRSSAPSPVFLALAIGFLGFWGLMAFLIVRGVRRSRPALAGARPSRGGWTTGSGAWSASSLAASDSSWSSSSSSDSSSSSSDFSGGGGDSGGGGASDSW